MDMKYFSDLWSNSKKHYTVEEKFWDKRAEEFNRKDIEEKNIKVFFYIRLITLQ